MFSQAGSSLRRALGSAAGSFPFPGRVHQGASTRLCSAAAAGGHALGFLAQGAPRLGGSLMLGTGVVVAASNLVTSSGDQLDDGPRASSTQPWVQALEASGVECLNPGEVARAPHSGTRRGMRVTPPSSRQRLFRSFV